MSNLGEDTLTSLDEIYCEVRDMKLKPIEVKKFIRDVKDLLIDERKKSYRINYGVILPSEGKFIVIGDIHGDIDTLLKILNRSEALRALSNGGYLMFLGDYIDRGPYQLESLLLVLRLKYMYPENVVVLRGNHEPPPGLIPYPHDFTFHLYRYYGRSAGEELYKEFFQLFQELPYVCIAKNSILFLHGGPPITTTENISLEKYLSLDKDMPDFNVLEEILWNDPVEYIMEWELSPRGAGKLFGPKITERALKITNTKIIVRGHEPCEEGFKLNHKDRVITLFSRVGPPYFNSKAAYMVINTTYHEWWMDLESWIKKIE